MKKIAKISVALVLLLAMTLSFASCGLVGMNLEKTADRLEKKDYLMWANEEDYVVAMSGEHTFFAHKYDNIGDAIEEYSSIKDRIDDQDGYTCGMKGTVVYYGTVQGVKDALGFPANLFVFEK